MKPMMKIGRLITPRAAYSRGAASQFSAARLVIFGVIKMSNSERLSVVRRLLNSQPMIGIFEKNGTFFQLVPVLRV
ncbi:MAG: hypothetical protein IPL79_18810 [Myxococcales bacterium]|nr:hypothetical protein [Myxococcales bacterium]